MDEVASPVDEALALWMRLQPCRQNSAMHIWC